MTIAVDFILLTKLFYRPSVIQFDFASVNFVFYKINYMDIQSVANQSIKSQVCATVVPMQYSPFRQFVLSGKNRYNINHAVVQKVVPRKIREPC